MKLWNDECGAVLSAELVLLMVIVGIAMVVGLKAVQVAVVTELEDTATAIGSIDQSYSYAGIKGCAAKAEGSKMVDAKDLCDNQSIENVYEVAGE